MSIDDTGRRKSVLIIDENMSVPRDRRVMNEASALLEAGYRVSVICPTGPGAEARHEVIDGVSIYRYSAPKGGVGIIGYLREYAYSLWAAFWLSLKVRRREGLDVIHACNPPDILFLIGLFHKWFGKKKFIFDHHDICPELVAIRYGVGKRSLLYKLSCLMERLTFRTADVVLSTNESYKRIAIERGKKAPESVFVVRNGPNLDRLRLVDPKPELKRNHDYLVCYVGVMGFQDGVDYLIRAAHHVIHVRGREDIGFAIIGDGDYVGALKKLAEELQLSDHLWFTGRISDSELIAHLSTADVCAAPDPVNEFTDKCTFIKVAEYMAMRKPVVAFNISETRYTAQEAAVYVEGNDTAEFGNKIIELIDDPVRRQEMGEFGRRRVESALTWDHSKPNLLEAYRRVFENNVQN